MASINDITLDKLQTKIPSKEYLNNYDLIFRKDKRKEETDPVSKEDTEKQRTDEKE